MAVTEAAKVGEVIGGIACGRLDFDHCAQAAVLLDREIDLHARIGSPEKVRDKPAPDAGDPGREPETDEIPVLDGDKVEKPRKAAKVSHKSIFLDLFARAYRRK